VRNRGEAAPWDEVADEKLYEKWIISPFARDVEFGLPDDVRRLLDRWKRHGGIERRVVLDLGCGRGDALALVAGRVGFAAGLDFSPRMLALAERFLAARDVPTTIHSRRHGARMARDLRSVAAGASRGPATALAEADIRNLSRFRHSADLVLAINSISPARATDTSRAFREVANTLKPGGTLMAVLASLDAFQYLTGLARRRGASLPDAGRVDADGMFHENGTAQKFFTSDEILALSRANGLRTVSISKVRYPWPLMRRFGWGYFPGRARLWDWHLIARSHAAGATSRRA
jgi:SAM-dependent methyltransferase